MFLLQSFSCTFRIFFIINLISQSIDKCLDWLARFIVDGLIRQIWTYLDNLGRLRDICRFCFSFVPLLFGLLDLLLGLLHAFADGFCGLLSGDADFF